MRVAPRRLRAVLRSFGDVLSPGAESFAMSSAGLGRCLRCANLTCSLTS
jgi:CHAD domain-containing protein